MKKSNDASIYLLPSLVLALSIAAFLLIAVYGYHHQPGYNHGYSKSDIDKVSRLLEHEKPLAVQLFADDGQPVDQRIKVREWHAARRTMGKEQ